MVNKRKKIDKDIIKRRFIFPELYASDTKLNETEKPQHSEELNGIKNSRYPGNEVLKLIEKRIQSIVANNYPLNMDNELIPTQLGSALINMRHIAELLKIIYYQIENKQPIDINTFEQLLFTNTMMSYQLGGHDQTINIGEHAANGYENNVLNPSKGGIEKAKKSKPVKDLVESMISRLNSNPNFNLPKNPTLSSAIYSIISEFAYQDKNIELKAFANFKDSCPEPSTIDKWVSSFNLVINKEPSLKSPSCNKIIELLQKDYPKRTLARLLKD